jgi:hypothetical protein
MSKTKWDVVYKNKPDPAPGDLIFAYHKGVHRVVSVTETPNDRYGGSKYHRTVTYMQVADSKFNPILRNRQIRSCDILWTFPFEKAVRADCFVNPEEIIERVKSYS